MMMQQDPNCVFDIEPINFSSLEDEDWKLEVTVNKILSKDYVKPSELNACLDIIRKRLERLNILSIKQIQNENPQEYQRIFNKILTPSELRNPKLTKFANLSEAEQQTLIQLDNQIFNKIQKIKDPLDNEYFNNQQDPIELSGNVQKFLENINNAKLDRNQSESLSQMLSQNKTKSQQSSYNDNVVSPWGRENKKVFLKAQEETKIKPSDKNEVDSYLQKILKQQSELNDLVFKQFQEELDDQQNEKKEDQLHVDYIQIYKDIKNNKNDQNFVLKQLKSFSPEQQPEVQNNNIVQKKKSVQNKQNSQKSLKNQLKDIIYDIQEQQDIQSSDERKSFHDKVKYYQIQKKNEIQQQAQQEKKHNKKNKTTDKIVNQYNQLSQNNSSKKLDTQKNNIQQTPQNKDQQQKINIPKEITQFDLQNKSSGFQSYSEIQQDPKETSNRIIQNESQQISQKQYQEEEVESDQISENYQYEQQSQHQSVNSNISKIRDYSKKSKDDQKQLIPNKNQDSKKNLQRNSAQKQDKPVQKNQSRQKLFDQQQQNKKRSSQKQEPDEIVNQKIPLRLSNFSQKQLQNNSTVKVIEKSKFQMQEIDQFKLQMKNFKNLGIIGSVKIPVSIQPIFSKKYVVDPQDQLPSPHIKKNLSDIVLSWNQLKDNINSIKLSNPNGIIGQILEEIKFILQGNEVLDLSTIKKINIFRLQIQDNELVKEKVLKNKLENIKFNRVNEKEVNELIQQIIHSQGFMTEFSNNILINKNISQLQTKDQDQQKELNLQCNFDSQQNHLNRYPTSKLLRQIRAQGHQKIQSGITQIDVNENKIQLEPLNNIKRNSTQFRQEEISQSINQLKKKQKNRIASSNNFDYLAKKIKQVEFLKNINPELFQEIMDLIPKEIQNIVY